ncbi:MAG: TetR/AcrR family transcriptional regulator [Chloroflexi bacterium]|nr:TetR/AcrR family transcriptional regulator [Chloroflexota bacterium]
MMTPRLSVQRKEQLESERKAQILRAALTVFARKGFRGATIAEIAKKAGVSEGTIYNYFRNKEDLLLSLPREILAPPLAAHFSPEKEAESPQNFLEKVLMASLEQFTANVDLIRVLLASVPVMDEAAREEYLRRTVLFVSDFLEKYFQKEIARGTYRSLHPSVLARTFFGMFFVFFVTQEILLGKRTVPLTYEEIAKEAVDLFLHGALASKAN